MPDHLDTLVNRFTRRDAVIAVVGLGYVGLPMVRAFHDADFRVIGFDIDQVKIDRLKAGESYLSHLGEDLFEVLARSNRFTPTSDPKDLAAAHAAILCVPTPLLPNRTPDLSYVVKSTEMVASVLPAGALISLESTSYPGTTREVCLPIIEKSGRTLGADVFVVFCPEREDPGRRDIASRNVPRLIGGLDAPSTRAGAALYRAAIDQVIEVESAEVAEAAKLLENVYRAVNIALVNELKIVFEAMNIDIWAVIKAAATKPYGFAPFYPGPGLGGHCIPIDPFYLAWKAHAAGRPTRFVELAGEINSAMPAHIVDRVAAALREDRKQLQGADVLVIGLAYKPDIDDVRESPAAEIIDLLIGAGATVGYHDPYVPEFPRMRRHQFDMASQDLTPERLHAADCVLIVTHHRSVDWSLIGRHARLIVDTRDAMSDVAGVTARVVKA